MMRPAELQDLVIKIVVGIISKIVYRAREVDAAAPSLQDHLVHLQVATLPDHIGIIYHCYGGT